MIDDGSTDNTQEALSAYRARLATATRTMQASARRGMRHPDGKGEWISFLDSDDEWLPNFISMQRDAVSSTRR